MPGLQAYPLYEARQAHRDGAVRQIETAPDSDPYPDRRDRLPASDWCEKCLRRRSDSTRCDHPLPAYWRTTHSQENTQIGRPHKTCVHIDLFQPTSPP